MSDEGINKNKVFISWEEVEDFIEKVAQYSEQFIGQVSGVYGIPRGGLIFAIMLSHKLNTPLLMAPCENCIIIDDIADSGRTLEHYVTNDTQFNHYFITTMYYCERSVVKPDVYYKIKKENEWVIFPWEINSRNK